MILVDAGTAVRGYIYLFFMTSH